MVNLYELDDVYNQAAQGVMEPTIGITTPAGLRWILSQRMKEQWEDPFLTWSRDIYTKRKANKHELRKILRPKNYELRKFLGSNRWERRT